MTTPASPAPGGGMPAAATAGQPAAPANLVTQAEARAADAEPGKPGLTAAEEKQLGDLISKRDAVAGRPPLRLKVTGDHESMTFGGLTIGREYTDVPPSMQGPITEAAALAGVEITQES